MAILTDNSLSNLSKIVAGLIRDNLSLTVYSFMRLWLAGITRAYSDLISLNVCPISCDHVQM